MAGLAYDLVTSQISTCHNDNQHQPCRHCHHDPVLIWAVYIFAIVLWLAILAFIDYHVSGIFDGIIILIPLCLFIIAMVTAGKTSPYLENYINRNNSVSNIVILIFPILVWATAKVDRNPMFLVLVVLATILAVLSLFDIWIADAYLGMVKHLRSMCQTLSITLTLLALYHYYIDREKHHSRSNDDNIETVITNV